MILKKEILNFITTNSFEKLKPKQEKRKKNICKKCQRELRIYLKIDRRVSRYCNRCREYIKVSENSRGFTIDRKEYKMTDLEWS